ncbi:signal peptidase II [Nocardioides pantholopis]|uniref:signal peptidase II n=1 Tax=Nocardioides pantholopis TaxID=2483798 RepID=UPI000F0770FB|nr:signal peptidase II [Nocardioides pantholopis]
MQAAGGASLNGAGETADSDDHEDQRRPTAEARSRWRRPRLLLVAVALVGYVVDVSTKVLAVARLQDRPDVPVVGDLLVLHLVRNPGAAFSTGTEYTVVLSLISIAAVVAICVAALRVRSNAWGVALGVLLAGVAGNLTDRILRSPGPLRGHVIDFLMLPNWPVFNVADICINLAAALIIVLAFRGIRLDGTRVA